MAGQPEKDSRTEEPTEKRRSEALEREGGSFSREVSSAAILMAVSLFLAVAAPGLVSRSAQQLAIFIEDPGGWRLENGEDANLLLQAAGLAVSGLVLAFAAAVSAAAIAASLLQNPPSFIVSRIMPDFSRISPGAGFNRLFNTQSYLELLKGLAKTGVTAVAAFAGLGGIATGFFAMHSTPEAVPELISHLTLRVVFLCAVMASVIAAADVFITRNAWRRAHMMSNWMAWSSTLSEITNKLKDFC